MKGVIIYATDITPRLEYAAEVIFSSVLGISYKLTSDRRTIGGSPAIIYSDEKVKGQFVVIPSGLLSGRTITPLEPEVLYSDDLPMIFANDGGSLPFDIFSAAFYMLSRYEEYLPFTPDGHGRFPGAKSLAYRGGFLQRPVVDVWSRYLAGELVKFYPVLTIRSNEYKPLVTIDVDQPFAYRSRGFLRSVGGLVKGLAGTGAKPAERIKVMAGDLADPYDTFDYIEHKLTEGAHDALFFFPLGDQGEHDHNPPFRDRVYGEIIRKYDKMFGSGIHPSYRSAGRPAILRIETKRYRSVAGHNAECARQHWLLLQLPDTYQSYMEAGIMFDYTMGYADEPGFRAGIARPFPFYDLSREEITPLTIVPFQVMDGTLRQYLHLSPDAALAVIKSLISSTMEVGGLFASIWHNTSLAEGNGWEGWRRVFEETLNMQKV